MEFSYQNIQHLANRISGLDPPLDGQERDLLVAIFAAAAAMAKPTQPERQATLPEFAIRTEPPPPEGDVDITDLRYQLLNAFIPGQDFSWVTTDKGIADKVVGQPVFPPPPPPPPPGDGE